MASCERYEEALWEAAETGNISADLQRHLEACADCRENRASLKKAMTGFTELRRMPEYVPAVTLAPLLPATPWWPRVALAGAVLALALVAVWVCLLAGKQEVMVTNHHRFPVVQPKQPEQPPQREPVIVEAPKQPPVSRVIRHAATPVRHRTAGKHHPPKPVPVLEQPAPEPQPSPMPEESPIEAMISAQPVNNLTAVSDLPLAYTIVPVDAETLKEWGIDQSPPRSGIAPAAGIAVSRELSHRQALSG
ncbi:MAG: hypothetical protein ACYDCO_03875 [Armatimonadota bacterium]